MKQTPLPRRPTTLRLLTINSACGFLGVSRAIVQRLVDEKKIGTVKIGDKLRIPEADLIRLIDTEGRQ